MHKVIHISGNNKTSNNSNDRVSGNDIQALDNMNKTANHRFRSFKGEKKAITVEGDEFCPDRDEPRNICVLSKNIFAYARCHIYAWPW